MLNGSFKDNIVAGLRGYPVDNSLDSFPRRLETIITNIPGASSRSEELFVLIQDAVVLGPCRDRVLNLRGHEAIAMLDALQMVHPALCHLVSITTLTFGVIVA